MEFPASAASHRARVNSDGSSAERSSMKRVLRFPSQTAKPDKPPARDFAHDVAVLMNYNPALYEKVAAIVHNLAAIYEQTGDTA